MKADLNITFYKEEKFKETPIGKIPEDWEIVKLEKICKKVKAGGTPLTSRKEFWNGKIPFVKIEDITSAGKYLAKINTFISEDGLKNSSAWMVPENSLLLAMYGSLGEISINKIPVATNQAILGIIPKNREDVEFLYYWYLFFKPNWRKYAKPTTQANLTAHIVRNSIIPLPPPLERKAVAHILSTIDEAIQKTDEIIEKTERLKKGLMQELLTKGIGHKEFKDTEIGKIPRNWNVVKLEDVAKFKRGFSYRSQDLNKKPTSIRFITINDIEKEGGIKLNVEPVYLNEHIKIDSNFFLESGDLLIANTDMSKGFIIGAPILIEKIETNAVYSMDLTKLIFNNYELESKYLFYYFKYEPTRQKMKSLAQGTNVLHLNHELIKSLLIPLPPLSEQRQIASILSTVDRKLEIERKRKEKLERIKKALMDLLLTGKVRVRT